eukprot:Rhum_TRINITY_DN13045_c1_g1::Rhum_TRINITY_DN13045_c1_g1_i1::g.56059::m.56059
MPGGHVPVAATPASPLTDSVGGGAKAAPSTSVPRASKTPMRSSTTRPSTAPVGTGDRRPMWCGRPRTVTAPDATDAPLAARPGVTSVKTSVVAPAAACAPAGGSWSKRSPAKTALPFTTVARVVPPTGGCPVLLVASTTAPTVAVSTAPSPRSSSTVIDATSSPCRTTSVAPAAVTADGGGPKRSPAASGTTVTTPVRSTTPRACASGGGAPAPAAAAEARARKASVAGAPGGRVRAANDATPVPAATGAVARSVGGVAAPSPSCRKASTTTASAGVAVSTVPASVSSSTTTGPSVWPCTTSFVCPSAVTTDRAGSGANLMEKAAASSGLAPEETEAKSSGDGDDAPPPADDSSAVNVKRTPPLHPAAAAGDAGYPSVRRAGNTAVPPADTVATAPTSATGVPAGSAVAAARTSSRPGGVDTAADESGRPAESSTCSVGAGGPSGACRRTVRTAPAEGQNPVSAKANRCSPLADTVTTMRRVRRFRRTWFGALTVNSRVTGPSGAAGATSANSGNSATPPKKAAPSPPTSAADPRGVPRLPLPPLLLPANALTDTVPCTAASTAPALVTASTDTVGDTGTPCTAAVVAGAAAEKRTSQAGTTSARITTSPVRSVRPRTSYGAAVCAVKVSVGRFAAAVKTKASKRATPATASARLPSRCATPPTLEVATTDTGACPTGAAAPEAARSTTTMGGTGTPTVAWRPVCPAAVKKLGCDGDDDGDAKARVATSLGVCAEARAGAWRRRRMERRREVAVVAVVGGKWEGVVAAAAAAAVVVTDRIEGREGGRGRGGGGGSDELRQVGVGVRISTGGKGWCFRTQLCHFFKRLLCGEEDYREV